MYRIINQLDDYGLVLNPTFMRYVDVYMVKRFSTNLNHLNGNNSHFIP